MLINLILQKLQHLLRPIYNKSLILQNLNLFIGFNIFLVIFTSVFAQSDNIGYFALFAILLTAIKLVVKTGEKFEMTIADKCLLVYFMFVIISVSGSTLFYLSLKGFFKTLTYLGFYVSVIHYLKDNKDKIKWIFLAFCVCASYETIFAFLQNFGAVEEISGWQDMSHLNPEEIMTRVYGTLKPYNPNLFGGYMLSIIPSFLVIPFVFEKKFLLGVNRPTLIIFSLLIGFLSLIALILTGCRGAYIGLFFQALALFAIVYKLLKPQLKKIFFTIVGFGALVVSFIIVSTASLRARIFSIFAMRSDSSNSFRFNVYHSCINMFKDNWLLGIGCGNQNFREIYGLYMKTGFDALSAYNIYLETAVESGIFALIAFLGFIGIKTIKSIRYVFNNRLSESIYVLAALLSIIGLLAHGLVDTVFFRPQIQFTFWIMISIIRVITNNKGV